MLVYGHGCYETVFSVADWKAPAAAVSLDLYVVERVRRFGGVTDKPEVNQFDRQISIDKGACRHQLRGCRPLESWDSDCGASHTDWTCLGKGLIRQNIQCRTSSLALSSDH